MFQTWSPQKTPEKQHISRAINHIRGPMGEPDLHQFFVREIWRPKAAEQKQKRIEKGEPFCFPQNGFTIVQYPFFNPRFLRYV